MPSNTYVSLATITLSSTDSEIVFSSIPATYRDLVLVFDGLTTVADRDIRFRLNGDSGTNYSYVYMYGTGSTTASTSASAQNRGWIGTGWSTKSVIVMQIMDYSATDKHKTVINREGSSSGRVGAFANRWASTSAVNSITFLCDSASFASGSTFSLYGIAS